MESSVDDVGQPGLSEERSSVTDAPSELGDKAGLADAERLAEERGRRLAELAPDMPDRTFDRITPQV